MANEFYNPSNAPATGSTLSSATIRAEFSAIGAAMDKMPVMAGNGDEVVTVNPGASGLTSKTSLAVVGEATALATSKATPVDADTLPITDSAAANGLKKLSWANLKAAVKAYYDPLTATLTNKTINLANNTLSGTLAQFSAAVSDADLVSLSGIETLTNKTLTSPILSNPAITGSISGTTDMGEVSLSAISQSLHSGSIVKAIVYDTTKDSDGGAWRKRTAHTSWYQEALGFTGKWLGQKTSTATAWATSGAAAGDGFQNSTDGKYYVLTGTTTASEIFRGNVREFPAVVAVVAETARVVIYDLTQPTCPMWMVFLVATNNAISNAPSSACAMNGTVAFACAGALYIIDFIADAATRRYISVYASNRSPLSGRNSAAGWMQISTAGIVNGAVNDCAITVLDTAPIDAATGLPVPTIAVATAGGVSVIKDDGTVVNSSSTAAIGGVTFAANRLAFSLTAAADGNGQTFVASMSLSASFTATQYSAIDNIYFPHPLKTTFNNGWRTGLTSGGLFTGGVNGVSVVKENPSTPTKGMVDYITNTYNSGWLVGDIKGAWLADTTVETISGSGELVTNGTFTTDTSGWTASAAATLAVVSGELQVTSSAAGSAWAYQAINVVPGRTYSLYFTQRRGTATGSRVFVGTAIDSANLGVLLNSSTSPTPGMITFSPSVATTVYINCQSDNASGTSFFDNISVKLAEPDRCVKNKGLIVNGSLTKTAVASGAGLVAYSGFSASNYLSQPYHSDLDFGTGDFCVMGWVDAATVGTSQYIFSRGAASNPTLALYHTTAGVGLVCSATAVATPNLVAITAGIHHIAMVRESGVLKLYFDNVLVYSAANTANITNTAAQLMFGVAYDGSTPYLGKLALWRIGATAPSADQIAHIYRTELPLFQANAQCTLAGTSTAVTTMAYDEDTTLLHVGTSWGRSSFKDLLRVDSEATTTGALTSLSASGGVIVTGGTSAKVYMPALLLRDELRRKAEARRALGKVPVFFDFTATASQTAFVAPKGYTIKALYHNGTLKREATTGVYWTRSNDGFAETATLSVGASASDWISIMAVRS